MIDKSHFAVETGAMDKLHAQLVENAQRLGLLDVAYRYVDTPVGTLLLAATDKGLVRVAHRKAIDITRQLSRRARMVSPTPPEELPECENGVEGASISHCDIWELVAALPLRQRQAIAYHYLGGLSYREAAELIGSNADAVRRAAADGMKKLRKSYRHD